MDFGMEEVFLKQMMIIWSVTALLGQWRRGRRAARSMEVPGKPLKRKDGFYRLPHGKVRKNRFRPRAKKNEDAYSKRDYAGSPWMKTLQNDDANGPRNPASTKGKKFRTDFRVPYTVFIFIVYLAKVHGWAAKADVDVCGRPTVPIELKILGVLYILGGDHGFDSVVDLGGFSAAIMNVFFVEFVSAFAIAMFPIWVTMPSTMDAIERVRQQFAVLGFPGVVGSADCTHIGVDKMPIGLKNLLTGRSGHCTLAYEVRRYLVLTQGVSLTVCTGRGGPLRIYSFVDAFICRHGLRSYHLQVRLLLHGPQDLGSIHDV